MKIIPKCIKTKRHLCASGSILLPLAQKWGLVGVVVCSLSLIGAGNVSAASITLSTPNKLEVSVIPSAEGTFAKSKAENISVTSDAYAGYTLRISGNDDNTLKSGENKLESFEGISGIEEATFNSAKYNNKWGYRPSRKNSVNNTNFFPGPTAIGDIIDITKSANPNINNYTVELGVRVDNSQAAGIYTGTFIISAVANDLTYTITYDKNAEDATNEPTKQASSAPEGTPITISEAPKRDKYVFMGWCDKETKDETCDGKIYQPKETYEIKNGDNTLVLYAMWVRIMQNWNECNTLMEHQTVTLIDIRDKNIYRVRKLKDENCWMIENLRLGDDKVIGLTSNDSDILGTWTLPAKSEEFLGNGTPEIWTGKRDENVPDTNEKYGVHYNWLAATAGTGAYKMSVEEATGSVCPSGWRLSTGGKNGDILNLSKLYSDTPNVLFNTSGANFVPSGRYYPITWSGVHGLNGSGAYGAYWTSTYETDGRAMDYDVRKSSMADGMNEPQGHGESVRCIVRE